MAPFPSSRHVRQLRRSERLELLRGSHYGFAPQGTAAITASEVAAVTPEEVWVVAEAGGLCAALEVPQFDQCLRGTLFPMGGIAGVWCYPEYRNRGFVRLLMASAWQQMRSRRQGVSMLCPFSVEYYAQFGYVPASGYGVVSIPLAAWQQWRGLDSEGWQVRRLPAEDVGEECLRFLRAIAPQIHGWAVPRAGVAQWRWWYQQRLCVFIQRAGITEAIALYSLQNSLQNGLPTTGQIKIWLWGWRNESARLQLLRFFAQHRDQVHTVTMELPAHTPLHRGWGAIPHLTPMQMALPWMVRVVDMSHLPPVPLSVPLGETIAASPVAIAISDPPCPWNEGIWLWSVHQGTLRCTRAPRRYAMAPRVTATIEAISALLYGTHTVAELVDRQWLRGDARTLEQFQTWLPPLTFHNPFKF